MNRPSPVGASAVAVAIFAGLIAALQMGKIPGALPRLIDEFSLSLGQSGLAVSSFSLLSAVAGLGIGLLSSRIGMWRAGILGLLLAAMGSILGAFGNSYAALLASRILEGFGFVLVAITMPGVINAVSLARWRALSLGIWGAFIPAAMVLALLASPPLLDTVGWRGLWLGCGALALAWAIVYGIALGGLRATGSVPQLSVDRVRWLLCGTPLAVVLVFVCYSAMFAAFTAFLPLYWEANGVDPGRAAWLAALSVAGNIIGNITAGYLIGRDIAMRKLIYIALAGSLVTAGLVFSGWLSLPGEVISAFMFNGLSGLLPGSVMASVGRIATSPDRIPLLVGLVFQGAGIGQFIGPLMLGNAVAYSGDWRLGGAVFALLAVTGMMLGRKIEPASGSTS